VLEASAGTGKTFTIAALATRYVAEGLAELRELMLVTFGRAATQELRERVRERLVATERILADPERARASDDTLEKSLADVSDEEVAVRRNRLTRALADFDAATITTTHGFCQQMLTGLGVAGDLEPDATFVESIDDLVVEVVDDLYLRKFGRPDSEQPVMTYDDALAPSGAAIYDPQADLEPEDAEPDSLAGLASASPGRPRGGRPAQASAPAARLRRPGDRLRDALVASPDARERVRSRFGIVMVDEFQDTDPAQWRILELAFHTFTTLVLIGDPKQAIYAFRGGDVDAYLAASGVATARQHAGHQLAQRRRPARGARCRVRRRCAGPRPDRGARRSTFRPQGHRRLHGAPLPTCHSAPCGWCDATSWSPAGASCRRWAPCPRDSSPPTWAADVVRPRGGRGDAEAPRSRPAPLAPGASRCSCAPTAGPVGARRVPGWRVPAVADRCGRTSSPPTWPVSGWCCCRRWSSRTGRFAYARRRSAASSVESPSGSRRRGTTRWTSSGRCCARGPRCSRRAAFRRCWSWSPSGACPGQLLRTVDGERQLTDLRHLAQSLHAASVDEELGVAALVEWLQRRIADAGTDPTEERSRRLESDADAVQVVTVHRSKGLEFPVVYVPFGWDTHKQTPDLPARCTALAGAVPRCRCRDGPRYASTGTCTRRRRAGEDLRPALRRDDQGSVAGGDVVAPTTPRPASPVQRLLMGSVAPGRAAESTGYRCRATTRLWRSSPQLTSGRAAPLRSSGGGREPHRSGPTEASCRSSAPRLRPRARHTSGGACPPPALTSAPYHGGHGVGSEAGGAPARRRGGR
jgi:exodeoxyribonuclease V beta subunit